MTFSVSTSKDEINPQIRAGPIILDISDKELCSYQLNNAVSSAALDRFIANNISNWS